MRWIVSCVVLAAALVPGVAQADCASQCVESCSAGLAEEYAACLDECLAGCNPDPVPPVSPPAPVEPEEPAAPEPPAQPAEEPEPQPEP